MPRLHLIMTQTGEVPFTNLSVQLPVCYMMVSTIETTFVASTIQQYVLCSSAVASTCTGRTRGISQPRSTVSR